MNSRELITDLTQGIDGVEQQGAKEIPIANLRAYLAAISEHLNNIEQNAPVDPVRLEHEREVWKAQLAAHSSFSVEMFKSVIEAGQTALKSAILINGGSAAALLAFAGNAITKGQSMPGSPLLSQVGTALALFTSGLGTAGVATGIRYVAQAFYSYFADSKKSWARRWGHFFNYTSVALGVVSFTLFFAGGVAAYNSIARPIPEAPSTHGATARQPSPIPAKP
ncbi:hypothetical protein [Burkholderia ambifaria]|uniref:hypothetical protein n=1 Tax=Burkholderia ambifaria TaxID=152480 RepID=UPI00158C6711|nr:hypothetical protein [Burkholderia ambifaria]